jgi:hypothetical protein
VAKSPADGHTLVMGTVGTHSINGALYSKMPYDMVKDFTPVAHVASAPNLLVVTNDLPVKNVAELIAYMKANPNKLSFGSPGIGTSVHVSGELFKSPDRHHHAARALQGPAVRHPRPGGRADPGDVRQHALGAADGQGRQDPRAGQTTAKRSPPRPTCPRWPRPCPASRPPPGLPSSRRPARRATWS